MFRRIVAFVLAAGSVMNAVAAPSSTSVLDTRDDPSDIMMFVCDQYPELCMNMCFGSFCAGNGESLTYDKPDKSTRRRREQASGCRPRPGRCSKPPYGDNFECDEFPFKSVADVDGGTRVNRCVPKDQNQAQGALIKAFYNSGFCKGKNPCSFNTGYENSGGIKYCGQETCENDGNEWTKGGQFNGRRDGLGHDDGVLFEAASNVTQITHATHFETKEGTKVRVPTGARLGQKIHRAVILDSVAWEEYIQERIAVDAHMTEDEYWASQNDTADQKLTSLIRFEQTEIVRQLD